MNSMKRISGVLILILSAFLFMSLLSPVITSGDISYPAEIDMEGSPYTVAIQVVTLPGTHNKNEKEREAAINAITVPAINCKVDIQDIWISDIANVTNMAVAGNEKIDLVHVGTVQPLSSLTSSDILLDLNEGDLLQNHGKQIISLFDDFLECGNVNGRQLAVPARTFNATANGCMYNKQMAEKAGVAIDRHTDLDTLENAFYEIHDHYPEVYSFYQGNGELNLLNWIEDYTSFGSEASCGIIFNKDPEYRICNLYETDMFRDYCLRMWRWTRDGIQPGDPEDSTSSQDYFLDGKLFSMISRIDANTAFYMTQNVPSSMDYTCFSDPMITNSNLTEYMWGIASNSMRPDKAMDFLNYAYCDARVANLLMFGVEDLDYFFVGRSENVIQSTGSYAPMFFQIGDRKSMLIKYPADETFPERATEYEQSAAVSPLCKYIFDSSDYQMETSMIYSTIMEYLPLLQCGICSSEEETLELLEEFKFMLKASGIEEVIAANQEQLDLYLNRE